MTMLAQPSTELQSISCPKCGAPPVQVGNSGVLHREAPDGPLINPPVQILRCYACWHHFRADGLPYEAAAEAVVVASASAESAEEDLPDPPAYRIIDITLIHPSPLNPRKVFDADALEELAQSIRTHGLQQPIVVRPDGDAYSIIMGERRYRACLIAGEMEIPAIVRADVTTSQQHLELALIENLHRRDIDAIEQAMGYAELSKMGYSYSQIAQKVNLSQPSIANAMRLLELPSNILAAVQRGELGPTHARALVKFAAFPKFLDAVLPVVIEKKVTTHQLESDWPYELQQAAEKAGALKALNYSAEFDWEKACAECPFGAKFKMRYAVVCLKPSHANELTREARKAKAEAEAALIAKAKADPKKIPDISKLRNCQELPKQLPAGCSEECECRILARGWNKQIVPVCTNLKRFGELKAADQAARMKDRVELIEAKHRKAIEAIAASRSLSDCGDLVALFVGDTFVRASKKDLRAVAKTIGIDESECKDPGVLAGTDAERKEAMSKLAGVTILRLAAAWRLTNEAANASQYEYYGSPGLDAYCALLDADSHCAQPKEEA